MIPWTEEAIGTCTEHPNICIDTSAYTFNRYPDALIRYASGHWRNKVMFGTNWPMVAPRKALEGLDAAPLDADAKALFLGENAARVYQLGTEGTS
jgi:predicted TIM-barrel fold metal-dependent hydrolase